MDWCFCFFHCSESNPGPCICWISAPALSYTLALDFDDGNYLDQILSLSTMAIFKITSPETLRDRAELESRATGSVLFCPFHLPSAKNGRAILLPRAEGPLFLQFALPSFQGPTQKTLVHPCIPGSGGLERTPGPPAPYPPTRRHSGHVSDHPPRAPARLSCSPGELGCQGRAATSAQRPPPRCRPPLEPEEH
jgi:hypothetical protein